MGAAPADGAFALDIMNDDAEEEGLQFFSVLKLGQKKQVQIPVGSGSSLTSQQVLLYPCSSEPLGTGCYSVHTTPDCEFAEGQRDPLLVLSGLTSFGSIGKADTQAECDLLVWQRSPLVHYQIPGSIFGCCTQTVCAKLIQNGAYPGNK